MFSKIPNDAISLGLGDRVGLAAAGHMAAAKAYDFFPVFAQQSVREMTFTRRTYSDIKADVARAAALTSWNLPCGFDGDHLKTISEIESALAAGISMLTLDCSMEMNKESPESERLLAMFADKTFEAGPLRLTFERAAVERLAAIYGGVVEHAMNVWRAFPELRGKVGFEISVDETLVPTNALTHFMLAHFLKENGVTFDTLAPRFPGEFQKGIDYIGDLAELEKSLTEHKAIADHFGYRLSVHSGSDKFSAFPLIGRILKKYHLKTAGTSYLEALEVIGQVAPGFFEQIWGCAQTWREEMNKYYHLGASAERVPKGLTPGEMLKNPDARQILHCSYMFTLAPGNELHERFMTLIRENERAYHKRVAAHIEHHARALGVPLR